MRSQQAMQCTLIAIVLQLLPFSAQAEVIHKFHGDQEKDAFGIEVENLGDLDGDGIHEIGVLAWGQRNESQPTEYNETYISIFSGNSGDLLYKEFSTGILGEEFSALTAAGDVDGDGTPDFMVTKTDISRSHSKVLVYSGAAFHILHTLPEFFYSNSSERRADQFGRILAGGSDLNGDGHMDILIGGGFRGLGGISQGPLGPYVQVYSGKTGNFLAEINTSSGLRTWGETLGIAVLDDLNGDGKNEIAVGEFDAGGTHQGMVHAFDGTNYQQLYTLYGDTQAQWNQFGAQIMPMSDMDGDLVGDILVSDGLVDQQSFFSGKTGLLIARWNGNGSNPKAVANVGDVNGDQIDDFTTGPFSLSSPGTLDPVVLYCGSSREPLRVIERPASDKLGCGNRPGDAMAGGGDWNGDGIGDILLGAPQYSWPHDYGKGKVLVIPGNEDLFCRPAKKKNRQALFR